MTRDIHIYNNNNDNNNNNNSNCNCDCCACHNLGLHRTVSVSSNSHLALGAMNATIENAEIHNIVGSYREPVTNTSGLKPRDVAVALV